MFFTLDPKTGPPWLKVAPKWSLDRPKLTQEAPRSRQNCQCWPKWPPVGPKWSQVGFQKRSKTERKMTFSNLDDEKTYRNSMFFIIEPKVVPSCLKMALKWFLDCPIWSSGAPMLRHGAFRNPSWGLPWCNIGPSWANMGHLGTTWHHPGHNLGSPGVPQCRSHSDRSTSGSFNTFAEPASAKMAHQYHFDSR